MLTVNTAAGHRGPVLVGHGVVKANVEEGMEHRESKGRKWKAEKEGKVVLWSGHWKQGRKMALER